jgi:epoxyqueuosine reductase
MPQDAAGRLDGWLFGCDVCQDVCPWNDRAVTTGETAFEPRGGRVGRDPLEVLGMSEEQFKREFRKSPVRRTKYDGLRRNAGALLGGPIEPHHPTHDDNGTNA